MRSLKDAMDPYTIRALTPSVDDVLWTVSELMEQGIVTQIPVPSTNAGTGTTYTVDSTTYNEWATVGTNDTAIELTGVRDPICEAFNTKFTGVTGAIPAAINGG
jgi:hypothetical protein